MCIVLLYNTKKDKTEFEWFRSRMLGGRTNHWGRISLRMGPEDFKPTDGLTDDWPITYDDVKPFYDKVDRMIGIYGTVEGIKNEPDGIFMKPPKPRLNELFIKKGAEKAGTIADSVLNRVRIKLGFLGS